MKTPVSKAAAASLLLAGCSLNNMGVEPTTIRLEEGLQQVACGLRTFHEAKDANGVFRTGLIPSEFEVNFKIAASSENVTKGGIGKNTLNVANAITQSISLGFQATSAYSRGNEITVKFANILGLNKNTIAGAPDELERLYGVIGWGEVTPYEGPIEKIDPQVRIRKVPRIRPVPQPQYNAMVAGEPGGAASSPDKPKNSNKKGADANAHAHNETKTQAPSTLTDNQYLFLLSNSDRWNDPNSLLKCPQSASPTGSGTAGSKPDLVAPAQQECDLHPLRQKLKERSKLEENDRSKLMGEIDRIYSSLLREREQSGWSIEEWFRRGEREGPGKDLKITTPIIALLLRQQDLLANLSQDQMKHRFQDCTDSKEYLKALPTKIRLQPADVLNADEKACIRLELARLAQIDPCTPPIAKKNQFNERYTDPKSGTN